jgi:hypothetical protein
MMEDVMSIIDGENAERLGRALARKAEGRDKFIGSAFALWRAQNDRTIEDQLKCSASAVWRLAITPKPASDSRFVETTMNLAVSQGANPTELVRLLRWAETVMVMQGAERGDGLLKAALDSDADEKR